VTESGEPDPLAAAAGFVFEMGQLKQLPRSGWLLLGIALPESVAEHSFRAAMTGMIIAAISGADVSRTAALCLFHDGHETRIGDVPSVGRPYVSTATPAAVTAEQTHGMPEPAARALQDLTAEYEANLTAEAQLAHDADKLEMLAQAVEYQAQGYDTSAWRTSALAALRTGAGQRLAKAVTSADPRWWAPVVARTTELRNMAPSHRPE
jgi:putative hydrolases of HD superfamily